MLKWTIFFTSVVSDTQVWVSFHYVKMYAHNCFSSIEMLILSFGYPYQGDKVPEEAAREFVHPLDTAGRSCHSSLIKSMQERGRVCVCMCSVWDELYELLFCAVSLKLLLVPVARKQRPAHVQRTPETRKVRVTCVYNTTYVLQWHIQTYIHVCICSTYTIKSGVQ